MLVALALGILLVWKNLGVPPELYRSGFFLGLASLGGWLFSPGGQMYMRIGRNPWKRMVFIPLGLMVAAPFIVLTEAGFAGYLGFAAFMRYVSLTLATIGLLGLSSSFVIPYLLRRQSTK
jgi:hypothetical protein